MYRRQRKLDQRQRAFVAVGLLVCVLFAVLHSATLYTLFYRHKTVQFSYGTTNCFKDITLLPARNTSDSSQYTVATEKNIYIRGYPLLAQSTCVTPNTVPSEGGQHRLSFGLLGNPLVAKRFTVLSGSHPRISASSLPQEISVKEPLRLDIDQSDRTFDYYVEIGDADTECSQESTQLACDVQQLDLDQGATYTLGVQRYFKSEKVAEVLKQEVRTVLPLNVIATSIAPNSTVYDSPTELTLTSDKLITAAEFDLDYVAEDGSRENIPHTVRIDDKSITITLKQPFQRKKSVALVATELTAADGSTPDGEYMLPFSISGGPKVVAHNLGNSSFGLSQGIVLTFDQELLAEQNASSIATLKSGGTAVAFTTSIQGNRLMLRPTGNLPLCAPITVELSGGMLSNHSIAGDSVFAHSTRTVCYTVSTIGYSVQGRAIQAWRFGSGPSKIMYIGATHGNEKSTKYLMDRWITELDANPGKIPAGRSIIVVPNVNPDGFASNSRRNANNVDLNRNFASNDWKSNVTMPGGDLVVNGGGATAASEPESKALASFVAAERPRLVLSYHSVAWIVTPNDAGDSSALSSQYAKTSGYRHVSSSGTGAVFDYDTTGAFESWLHDKLGIPALVIELGSNTDPQWSRNQAAMWLMAQL